MFTLKIGINASRAKSGGGISHLKGILQEVDWELNKNLQIFVWSHKELLDQIPNHPNIIKFYDPFFDRSIVYQLYWERFLLPKKLKNIGCKILLNVDAGTVCRFDKMVTMSRDMLSYEPGEIDRFPLSKEKIRLFILKFVQNSSLRASNGVIFLTKYASKIIQQSSGQLPNFTLIPHGVGKEFSMSFKSKNGIKSFNSPIELLYISNIAPYKHQWNVVKSVKLLRDKGYNVQLSLTGGGHIDGLSHSQKKLDLALKQCDPDNKFVKVLGYLKHDELPKILHSADIFVFASSCENMPNTLIEAMSVGLPIACSNRGPMPEVLEDAGVYFDPDDYESIASAIEIYLQNSELMISNGEKAKKSSMKFSWERCSKETLEYIKLILFS